MNRIIRAFAAFIVSICLILLPPMAYASTSAGGWTALDTVTAGATNTINATKTAGGKALNSAITIAPQAGKVGKHLIKGGGQAALVYAVVELLGEGVDWVLDPANNSVKYKNPAGAGDSTNPYIMECKHNWSVRPYDTTPEAACRSIANNPSNGRTFVSFSASGTGGVCSVKSATGYVDELSIVCSPTAVPNPNYGNTDNYSSIPIDTVAAKVISNAAAGHAPSQEAVKAAALEGFAAGEHDAALDAAAVESDAGTENPPDTDNPPATDPAVPFDDSSILAAIASLKAVVAGLLSSVGSIGDTLTQFYDWATADPQLEEPEEFKPEIGDPTKYDTVDLNQGYVTASGQCPPAADLNINFGVVKLSYEPLCIILDKLSGVIVAVAYISVGFMIIRTV